MDRQPDLFQPRARSDDPSTSHRAARLVSEYDDTHFGLILRTLKDGPGTFYEIATRCGLQPPSVWRRMPELERLGKVATDGSERPGPSGRMCRIWRLATIG